MAEPLKLPTVQPQRPQKSGSLKLPSASGQEQPQKPSGAGRFLTEKNGVPVWVDSSQSTGRTGPSEAQNPNSTSKTAEQTASAIKRKLGI